MRLAGRPGGLEGNKEAGHSPYRWRNEAVCEDGLDSLRCVSVGNSHGKNRPLAEGAHRAGVTCDVVGIELVHTCPQTMDIQNLAHLFCQRDLLQSYRFKCALFTGSLLETRVYSIYFEVLTIEPITYIKYHMHQVSFGESVTGQVSELDVGSGLSKHTIPHTLNCRYGSQGIHLRGG